jgi:uncharacterized protein (DUF305 family)
MKTFFCYLLPSALLACSVSIAQTPPAAGHSGMHGMGSDGSKRMHEQMMNGMQKMQGMQPSGDVDKDFAMMMRVHHQQAVDMARVQVKQGKSPELKAMAEKMIRDQQKEIDQFDKWLAAHK